MRKIVTLIMEEYRQGGHHLSGLDIAEIPLLKGIYAVSKSVLCIWKVSLALRNNRALS